MSYNKRVFPNEAKTNNKFKSFIIAFAVFIVLLSVCSVVLFMYSLDFDINNLVESTTVPEETTTEQIETAYSVESLSGNSNIMFIITDSDNEVQSVFCTLVDFDNKAFNVKQVDGDAQYLFDTNYRSINGIYSEFNQAGVAEFLYSKWNIKIDKYVVFKMSDLRRFLSSFNGITINVTENVNYKSSDYNIELKKGLQELSGEKALNYLMICDNREQVFCDIISSVLTEEYVEKSETLFKNFVNASETDISIIDFYDSLDTLEIYCRSEDKFLPQPFMVGE